MNGAIPTQLLLVAAGGAAGTALRYGVARSLALLFLVNVAGSLAAGVVDARGGERARVLVGTGFCGGLTTMSALSVGTDRLVADGRVAAAVLYLLATVGCGIAAARAGARW